MKVAKGTWRGTVGRVAVSDAEGRKYEAPTLLIDDGPELPNVLPQQRGTPQRPILTDERGILLALPGVQEGDMIRVEGKSGQFGHQIFSPDRTKVSKYDPRSAPVTEQAILVKRWSKVKSTRVQEK